MVTMFTRMGHDITFIYMTSVVSFYCRQDGFMLVVMSFTSFRRMCSNFVIRKCYFEAKRIKKKVFTSVGKKFFRRKARCTIFDHNRNLRNFGKFESRNSWRESNKIQIKCVGYVKRMINIIIPNITLNYRPTDEYDLEGLQPFGPGAEHLQFSTLFM